MFIANSIKIFIIIAFLCLYVKSEFPDDPKPCKYEDAACIAKLIHFYMNEKSKGETSINLIDINPLPVKRLRLQQGRASPVNIDMMLTDNQVYGFNTAKVKKVKGFGKDLTKKHTVVINFDYLSIVGSYEINGKILILPISGKGKSNMTMINADLSMEFTGTPVVKDGATYMKIDKMDFDADPKLVEYYLGNLFNGDKALGENMNLFLNQNWQEIYNEMRESFDSAFKRFPIKIIDSVFTKHPYDKYFVE